MPEAFLSKLDGYWSRLRGRSKAPITPAALAVAPDSGLPTVADPVATMSAGDPAAVAARQEAEAHALTEMIGRPVANLAGPALAPASARERTLGALANLQQIPALQSLAQGFVQAINQPNVSVAELVSAISKDAALCVRVLRMSNSMLVSPDQPIEDLDTAVQMLGVVRVRRLAQALFTLRDAKRVTEGFDWRHLWFHALGTAAIAEELDLQLRRSGHRQLYLAGLLHDVGKIVLATIAPEDYRTVLVAAWNEQGRLEDLERARLGVDHREAGMIFARANGLPEMVVEAIAHHDAPEQAEKFNYEVALVALADYQSKVHGLGFSGSRVGADDPDWSEMPAWSIVAEAYGLPPNIPRIEARVAGFAGRVKDYLRELREVT